MGTGRAETGSRNNTERTASCEHGNQTGFFLGGGWVGVGLRESGVRANGLFLCPSLLWVFGGFGNVIFAVLCNQTLPCSKVS